MQVLFDDIKSNLIFIVSDTGRGIQEYDQIFIRKLFEKFTKSNFAFYGERGRVGLGLFMSKQVIE